MKERTLDLVLKGCWYDLIKRGVKREEYREIKPYWEKRLLDYKSIVRNLETIKFKQIILGKSELGAPQEEVFIIKFSEI